MVHWTQPQLYSYWRSSCSWRVRIGLNLHDIEYEYNAVHLVKDGGQQHSAEYSEMNPMRSVPTLVLDGARLTQSMAILEYLEERSGKSVLLPEEPLLRAKVRALTHIVVSDCQPVQNLAVLLKVIELTGDSANKLVWGAHFVERALLALEKEVQQTAGQYCVGDRVTMVDVVLVPQLYNARRFKCDLSKLPTLLRVEENLVKLPAFQAAHPDKQPDAQ